MTFLKKGSETAKHEAEKTLAEVKHAMKIDYFDTPEFFRRTGGKNLSKKYEKAALQVETQRAVFILHVYGLRSAVFCDKVYRYIFVKGKRTW